MRILSSGVYAACCCAVGVLWSCSDSSSNDISGSDISISSSADYLWSSESGNSPDKNYSAENGGTNSSSSITSVSESSSGTSPGMSTDSRKSSSSNHTHRSSSSGSEQGKSSGIQAKSSSSEGPFVYTSPANFADTVNGVAFNMVYVAGGS